MPRTVRPAPRRPEHIGGLDGLRAIAVGLVLVYHLFPGTLMGGFLGVDVFFAISGFLITTLLLRELRATGRIALLAFWRRRARRLLPALGLVLLVCSALGLLVGGDVLVGLGGQLFGAAFFVSNWVFVASGADYFAQDLPELFRNTWSLAIEEQFYLLLPPLVLLLFALRRRWALVLPLLALGCTSAWLMHAYSSAGLDPSRAYFGSDSHAFGLLWGAALAAILHRPLPAVRPLPPTTRAQLGYCLAVLGGLGVLGWLALVLPEASPESFSGGFQLATIASLAVVWGASRPGSWAGRALDNAPMRWVGERSYGIYLWHWPLLVLLTATPGPWRQTPQGPWIVGAATLVLTVAVSAASFRYVEQPVRRIGLAASLRLLLRAGGGAGRRRAVAAALGALLVATLPATAYAIAVAPRAGSGAEAIERGQAALDEREAEEDPQEDDDTPPDPSPVHTEGRDISAIGDSVMLASAPELGEALRGVAIDAEVSRGMGAGVSLVAQQLERGELRSVVVVGLGTNGPVQPEELDALRDLAGPRPLVLVNAHAERDWIAGVNETLRSYADAHRGVVVADWDAAVEPHSDALAGDGIHPNPSGGEIYARAIERALDELETPAEALGFGVPRR